ncbi:hypothetical protein IWQ57_006916, partial [Coemansia nantahalensis]
RHCHGLPRQRRAHRRRRVGQRRPGEPRRERCIQRCRLGRRAPVDRGVVAIVAGAAARTAARPAAAADGPVAGQHVAHRHCPRDPGRCDPPRDRAAPQRARGKERPPRRAGSPARPGAARAAFRHRV